MNINSEWYRRSTFHPLILAFLPTHAVLCCSAALARAYEAAEWGTMEQSYQFMLVLKCYNHILSTRMDLGRCSRPLPFVRIGKYVRFRRVDVEKYLRHQVGNAFHFPFIFQLGLLENAKKAANSSVFEFYYKLPKLRTWVRFPSPAPETPMSQAAQST